MRANTKKQIKEEPTIKEEVKLTETPPVEISRKAPLETTQALPDGTPPPAAVYTEEELYIMSHLIGGEAGASWASDELQQLVGLVVMNRVDSPLFPDTIKDVVFQRGQYACTWDGNYDKEPSEQSIENAKKVLSGTTDIECPPNVVFQSNSKQGAGVYYEIYDKYLKTTTYFCYTDK